MSIRRYLVLNLFAVLTLITFVAAIQGYKHSMERASKQFDQQLVALAQTLTVINITKNALNSGVDENQVSILQHESSFAFQIFQKGQLILRSKNAPNIAMNHSIAIDTKIIGFMDGNFLGQRWRVYSFVDSIKVPVAKQKIIIVAQPLQKRFAFAQDVILSAVTPMIIAIGILSLLIYIIITRGLRPLRQLTKELVKRKTNDFTPLKLKAKNSELESVIATLNQLFSRLNSAFERERHFASDAAHELKTPLSVLKINAYNIQHDLNQIANYENDSVNQLVLSVDRMSHVIDQILNLNRTNPEQLVLDSKVVNINYLLQNVIRDLYDEISQREQTIELLSDDISLMAHEFSLQLMLQNLISNASKYTPNAGVIKVSAFIDENEALKLTVEDSGSGIATEEYKRVFDRFYRVGGDRHSSTVIGCGLGLAIVKHIVLLHGASIELSKSIELQGLQATVTFPKKLITAVSSTIGSSEQGVTSDA